MAEGLTLVNAVDVARERKIEILESTSSASISFANLVALRLKTSEEDLSVAGTVFGGGHLRLVDVDGVEVDTIPQGNVLVVRNEDTPGIVGRVGTRPRRPRRQHRPHGPRPQAGQRPGDHADRGGQRGPGGRPRRAREDARHPRGALPEARIDALSQAARVLTRFHGRALRLAIAGTLPPVPCS